MPVPATIDDLSTTAGSNSPTGGETPKDGDNYIRSLSAFIAALRDKLDGTSSTGTITNATFVGLATFPSGANVGNVASGTATTLDWYEEGTTTPTVRGETSAGTATYSNQQCYWQRIGNRVNFYIDVTWSGHTGTGNAQIVHGIPYLPTTSQTLQGAKYESSVTSVNQLQMTNSANWTVRTINFAVQPVSGTAEFIFNGSFFLV